MDFNNENGLAYAEKAFTGGANGVKQFGNAIEECILARRIFTIELIAYQLIELHDMSLKQARNLVYAFIAYVYACPEHLFIDDFIISFIGNGNYVVTKKPNF